jgi:hypothetical protein
MEAMVSKGFLIFAQNKNNVDYVRQAYALALSIKHSQQHNSVTLVTNDIVPDHYHKAFDKIIPIPWFTEVSNSLLATEHRWKLYHITPYDETIVLDSDMLFLEDISDWWKYCSNYDVKFCSKIRNYKQEYLLIDDTHRKTFIANNLTNPYYALHYFKKSDTAHEFYKVLEFVCNNWEKCSSIFAPDCYQNWASMDLAAAIAIEITGQYISAIDNCSPLEFIHMKIPLQGWPSLPTSWQDAVPFVLNSKGDLIVGNIKQQKLFHYVEKNFITEPILTQLEELVYGS